MLKRIYDMQVDAFGPNDERCSVTKNKIAMLEKKVIHSDDKSVERSMQSIPILSDSVGSQENNKSLGNALKLLHDQTRVEL